MLLGARIASMAGGGNGPEPPILPYKSRLMWAMFGTTAETFVDTGITAVSGKTIDISARFPSDSYAAGNQIAAGSRVAVANREIFMGQSDLGNRVLMIRRNESSSANEYRVDGQNNANTVVRMMASPTRADVLLDGVAYGGTTWSGSTAFNLQQSLCIGKMNGTTWGGVANMCIYGFSIYDDVNGDTMRLIPVVDNDDRVCFYDDVSQSFVYNSGSGSLTAGPVVNIPPVYNSTGLVAMWDGEENSSNTTSTTWVNLGSKSAEFNAYRNGGVFSSTGAEFSRSGSNASYFSVGPIQSDCLKGEWTAEVVFTPRSGWFNNYSGIFGNHRSGFVGLQGGQYADGYIYFNCYGAPRIYRASPSDFPAGSTCSVVMVGSASSGTAAAYKNGVQVASSTGTSAELTLTDPAFCIGAAYPGSDRLFDGTIHALRLYNRALSASEIAANYAIDKARFGLP